MVHNSMYPVGPRPYILRDNKKLVKQREDEESSQFSQSSKNNQDEQPVNQAPQRKEQQLPGYRDYQQPNNFKGQQQLNESKKAQDEAKISYNMNVKNSTINVAQIIKDFKNTASAIGTPDDLNTEVNTYLTLIETQVSKEEPNVKLIKSNLVNASCLLDSYITETLQRPSNVVQNWMEALFLQKINFKFDTGEVNPLFLVKFPDDKKSKKVDETEETEETTDSETNEEAVIEETKTPVVVPQDAELKSLFLQAKKYSYANDSKKAMEIFQKALNRSVAVNDIETQSKVLFEIGKLYDKNDFLSQALTSYDKSIKTTKDDNIKTQAHFSMGQIYDDVAQFDPAINHYMSSISYAGQSENFTAQSGSLTKIGNMYSEKYNKEAFAFYSEAKLIATESKDAKTKGYVSSNMAGAYKKFNEPKNALNSYSDAIKEYTNAQSPLQAAKNYKSASEVMLDYGNPIKAKSLLEKALASAKQANNTQLVSEIQSKLDIM